MTTVFFRALQSHDFDTETDISEDNVTLSLIRYWKANRILWDGESGIIPHLSNLCDALVGLFFVTRREGSDDY